MRSASLGTIANARSCAGGDEYRALHLGELWEHAVLRAHREDRRLDFRRALELDRAVGQVAEPVVDVRVERIGIELR